MVAFQRNRTLPIGMHIGPQSATMVQLARNGNDLELHAMAHVELPNNEEAASDVQDREIAAILKRTLSDHGFRGKAVVSCLGAQHLFVQNVRLPKLPPEEVDKVVRWEAEERLPYPVADAEIRHLLAGEVRQDANIKQEVVLLACHQGVLQRHIALLEMSGLVPEAIDVEPCALLRSLWHTADKSVTPPRQGYLLLGERTTAVIIAEGEQVLFLKYINSGGNQLDQMVARHLDLPIREAAKMRAVVTESAKLDAQDEVHRSIAEAIRGPLDAMSAEIELCLRYYKVTFRGQPLDKLVIAGSEASAWLAEYLGDRLNLPSVMANPFESLRNTRAASFKGTPSRWTTALGLSLKLNN